MELCIVSAEQAALKLRRMAMQITESYPDTPCHLIGLQPKGYVLASILHHYIGGYVYSYEKGNIHPTLPPEPGVCIVVDDVLYTGKTLFEALQAIYRPGVSAMQVAVLVDRGHRKFPILASYVGLNVETTLQDYVEVRIQKALPDPHIEVFLR